MKLVKFQGEFVWHHHDHEDELFLVVKGRFRMEFRDRHVWLEEGEFLIVPRGVEQLVLQAVITSATTCPSLPSPAWTDGLTCTVAAAPGFTARNRKTVGWDFSNSKSSPSD